MQTHLPQNVLNKGPGRGDGKFDHYSV
uniref:Uncharacterized protein n=1 Tax=Anguilla anguilla TaxID=7936 RepID=A0A0E9VD42_ANGAN